MAATFPQVCEVIQQAIGPNPRRGRLKEIANEIPTSAANISRWYGGESSPDREHWPRIEEVLHIPTGGLAQAAAGLDVSMFSAELPPEIILLPALVEDLRLRLEAIEAALARDAHPVATRRAATPQPKVVPIERPQRSAAQRKKPQRRD